MAFGGEEPWKYRGMVGQHLGKIVKLDKNFDRLPSFLIP
jgi:hypothetical protein